MDPVYEALKILVLLFSVILHEVMHGYVALRLGDHTAEKAGRLTLNPIPHIDPIGTILVPLILTISQTGFLLGWAKPVPVNPLNFSNIRKGELYTAAAGVLANFGLAIGAALLFHILNTLPEVPILLLGVLQYTILINLVLGVFNLFPIPPLDGSKVLMSVLPYNLAREYAKFEQYGFLILISLMLIPFGGSTLLSTILMFFVRLFGRLLGL